MPLLRSISTWANNELLDPEFPNPRRKLPLWLCSGMPFLLEGCNQIMDFVGSCKAQIGHPTGEKIQNYTYLSNTHTFVDWQVASLKKTGILVQTNN